MPILAAFAVSLLVFGAAPAQALTSAAQTFDLTFTLEDIRYADTGQSVDPFILEDIFIDGFFSDGPSSSMETGTGSVASTTTPSYSGGPFDMFDSFEGMVIGDSVNTVQTQTATVASLGEAQLFEDFMWSFGISSDAGEDLFFDWSWSYTRDITLVEEGDFDDATAFLGDDLVFFLDDNGDEVLAEGFLGTDILNFGTLPPGDDLMFTDSGSFTAFLDSNIGNYLSGDFSWNLGVRAVAEVPEPHAALLLLGGIAAALRRRR